MGKRKATTTKKSRGVGAKSKQIVKKKSPDSLPVELVADNLELIPPVNVYEKSEDSNHKDESSNEGTLEDISTPTTSRKITNNNKKTNVANDIVQELEHPETIQPNFLKENGKKKKTSKKDKIKNTEGLSEQEILAKIQRKKAKKIRHKLKKKEKKNKHKIVPQEAETDVLTTAPDETINPDMTISPDVTISPTVDELIEKYENRELKFEMNFSDVKTIDKKKRKKEKKEKKEKKVYDPAATIFVGNLPTKTKRNELVKHFQNFGPIEDIRYRTAAGSLIRKHKNRNESSSLNAYVTLQDAALAAAALSLNGSEFKGHHLRVTTVQQEFENISTNDVKRTIFVGNLKYSATEEKLYEIFSNCGEVEYVRCLHGSEMGCKGVAYVCFKTPDAVGLALELNKTLLDDRPINVERYSLQKLKSKSDGAGKAKPTRGGGRKVNNKKGAKEKVVRGAGKKLATTGKKKKGEYRGVKVNKMKAKAKKKRAPSAMQKLAKKIAPKPK